MSAFERKLKGIKELLREPVVMVPVSSMDLGLKLLSGRVKLEKLHEETLEIIGEMEEQIKALRVNNTKPKSCIPEPPCNAGDPLWAVFEESGMISVTKEECKALLWDGESWLISVDECCWEVPGEECVFLSIEAAVKKAEEMLRNGNDA